MCSGQKSVISLPSPFLSPVLVEETQSLYKPISHKWDISSQFYHSSTLCATEAATSGELAGCIFRVTVSPIQCRCHPFPHQSLFHCCLEHQLWRLGTAFRHAFAQCLGWPFATLHKKHKEIMTSPKVMFWGWGSCFAWTGT